MYQKSFIYIFFTLVSFFVILFVYTNLAGPIPLSINSVTTQKSDAFNVTGEGSVFVTPDVATINAGISANGPTVKAVQEQINSVINKVSAAVKEEGVDSKDIQTGSYNISPTYDFSANTQRITGYTASTSLNIKVRQIEKTNDVIDAAAKAGANQVGNVNFEVSDKAKAENEAREKAVNNARQKAQNAAKIGGFSLGRLVNYSEDFQGVPPRLLQMGAVSRDAAETPTEIEKGTNEVKVVVTLSYEIR